VEILSSHPVVQPVSCQAGGAGNFGQSSLLVHIQQDTPDVEENGGDGTLAGQFRSSG
jgi:hypothetical protein